MTRFLFSIVMFVSQLTLAQSLPSHRYEDYDQERYQRYLDETEDTLRRTERELEQRERALQQTDGRWREVSRRLDDKQKELASLRAREVETGRALESLVQKIQERSVLLERTQQLISSLEGQISSGEGQVARAQEALQLAKVGVERAQGKLNEANALPDSPEKAQKVAAAQQELAQAQAQLSSKQSEADQIRNQVDGLKRQRDQMKAEADRARNEIASDQRKAEEMRQSVAQIRNQIPQTQNQVAQLTNDEMQLRREVEMRNREREEAVRAVRQRRQEREQAVVYLNNVIENIRRAKDAIQAVAVSDARADGSREGRELGSDRGQRDGQSRGQTEGHNQGTSAGQSRDYDAGRAQGQAEATTAATKKATDEAEVEGKRDGEELGKRQGLKASYDQGFREGSATANDAVAYKIGRDKGEAKGLEKAIADAQYRDGEGFKDRSDFYRSQTLKVVELGDSEALSKSFKGNQGSHSGPGDDRYYNPRPASYPHPRLTPFYMEAYEVEYRETLEESYNSNYEATYRVAYQAAYDAAYRSAYNKDYPESRQDGYDQGWSETYPVVFKQVKAREYAARKEKYRQIMFDRFKNDPTERARGFKDGNADASEKKGYKEGFDFAYAQHIEDEKNKAYARGVAKADELYTKNAVLEMESIDLVEGDRDSVLRPGEALQAVIKLKNYGLVGKSGLVSGMSDATGVVVINQAKATLAVIPPQSQATVTVAAQAQVLPSAKEGQALGLQIQALDGSKVLLAKSFSKKASFPTLVAIKGFDGILIPGVKTSVKLAISNRSSKVQTLNLNVQVDSGRVALDRPEIQVQVGAGQTVEETLSMTGSLESEFEESPLKIITQQKNLIFAADVNLNMTIIKRHQANADSKGLIVSQNLAVGGGKALFKSDKLDTWDLRVDGVLTAEVLKNYINKVVHVMADANASLDAQTAAVLVQHVKSQKATVIVWGARLQRSGVLAQLASILSVSVSETYNFNEKLNGLLGLSGIQLSYAGEGSVVSSGSRLSDITLKSSDSALALTQVSDGQSERSGSASLVALDAAHVDSSSLQKISSATNVANLSFEQKLKGAKDKVAYVKLVLQDLRNELSQADINNAGNYYEKKGAATKIGRAIKLFLNDLDKKTATRIEFVKSYALIAAALAEVKNSRENWQASLVMEKRYGFLGKTWKEQFCEINKNSTLCETGPGSGDGGDNGGD